MSTDSPKLKKKVISGGIHRRVRIKWKSDGSRGIPVSEVIVNRLLQRFRRGFHRYTLLLRHFAYGKSDSARHDWMSLSAGNTNPSPLFTSGECFASVSLADISISSVMRDAPEAITPDRCRENIGVITLCDRINLIFPDDRREWTAGCHQRVAFRRAIMSCGVASTREVGLESGMTIGRGQCLCISRMISSVKSPVWPETPIRISGFTLRTTSSSDSTSFSVSQCWRLSHFCTSFAGTAINLASGPSTGRSDRP